MIATCRDISGRTVDRNSTAVSAMSECLTIITSYDYGSTTSVMSVLEEHMLSIVDWWEQSQTQSPKDAVSHFVDEYLIEYREELRRNREEERFHWKEDAERVQTASRMCYCDLKKFSRRLMQSDRRKLSKQKYYERRRSHR